MEAFLKSFIDVYSAGGFLMYPLVILSVYMYYTGFEMYFKLVKFVKVVSVDSAFDVAYDEFLSRESLVEKKSLDTVKIKFSRLRAEILNGIDRRIVMLKILSSVAPLIGLLGTVIGIMLAMSSISSSDSSDVAYGISSALITTQAGLVVAIPAWILTMGCSAKAKTLLYFLAKQESRIIKFYRK